MTVHPTPCRTFISAAVQRAPNREQLGVCVYIPAPLTDRFVEDDTQALHFEIVRLTSGYHLQLVDEIPAIPEGVRL